MDEKATLGGGCFWCLEAAYEQVGGIRKVVSGYAGGEVDNPTYRQVCSGSTGHAEVVQLTYDPDVITYRDILDIFFTIHDPTTLNRQGADVGTQYRSVIYHHDDEQKRVAEETMARLTEDGVWDDTIVTELSPLPEFYPAEEYHQNYFQRNPNQPYCQVVIAPKIAKLRKQHFDRLASNAAGREDDSVRAYQTEPPNPVDQGGIRD